MNVALFASAYYPHLGGVEEHVRQIARAFRRDGINAVILTNRWPRSLPAFEEYEGTPVYRLAFRMPEGSMKACLNYRLTHPGIRREMLAILTKHQTDLLHVHCVSANGHYAHLAKKALGLPLIVTTHGERTMDATGLYQRSALMNRVLRGLLAEADHITACSRHTLDDMECYWGQSFGKRAQVVYNGIDFADFEEQAAAARHQDAQPFILGMGRLVPQKGFDVLLKAFAQADITSHALWLAGEGTERPVLEELSRNLGLEKRVRFLGRADRPNAVALFKSCSFFAMPSRREPLGIVNLEAMAAGKAVVASRTGGVPEVIQDGSTGLLVPPEDVSALSEALTQLAADEGLRKRLGTQGREHVRQFTWNSTAQRYQQIYAQLLDDPGWKRDPGKEVQRIVSYG